MLDIVFDEDSNCRGQTNPETCRSLALDIETNGLINPLTLRIKDDNLILVSGYRRYLAVMLLGWDTVPCIIRDLNDAQANSINVTENVERENLSLEQEVEVVSRLKKSGLNEKQMQETLKRSYIWVKPRLEVSKLPESLKQLVYSGILSMRNVVSLTPKELRRMKAEEIMDRRLIKKQLNKTNNKFAKAALKWVLKEIDNEEFDKILSR